MYIAMPCVYMYVCVHRERERWGAERKVRRTQKPCITTDVNPLLPLTCSVTIGRLST